MLRIFSAEYVSFNVVEGLGFRKKAYLGFGELRGLGSLGV